MVHIAWVYSTDNDQYCRDAESDLTHHFHLKSETDEEGSFKLDNDRHGGGEMWKMETICGLPCLKLNNDIFIILIVQVRLGVPW